MKSSVRERRHSTPYRRRRLAEGILVHTAKQSAFRKGGMVRMKQDPGAPACSARAADYVPFRRRAASDWSNLQRNRSRAIKHRKGWKWTLTLYLTKMASTPSSSSSPALSRDRSELRGTCIMHALGRQHSTAKHPTSCGRRRGYTGVWPVRELVACSSGTWLA